LPTCRHLNIAGVSILLGLVGEFLVLVVISEQLVDVCHHVVGIGVSADVVVAELVKFAGGLFLRLNVVVVGDAIEQVLD
jgi:hypothetical protein